MSVFDKLKSTFKDTGTPQTKPKKKNTEAHEQTAKAAPVQSSNNASTLASLVLRYPHISEKASTMANESTYVFRVAKRANKIDVKRAIEELYGVTVANVRILNTKSKARRLGRIEGRVPGYKKAMVELSSGSKIDIGA